MKCRDLWKLSLRNACSSPMRSVLTVLGMAIGVGAILAVLALGDAGKTQVRAELARLGIDKVWVSAAQGEALTRSDVERLARGLNAETAGLAYAVVPVYAVHGERTCAVVGCTRTYLTLAGMVTLRGRMPSALEWTRLGESALLGERLARELRVGPGDRVQIGDTAFVLRGVIRASGAFSRVETENAVYVPLEAFERWMGDKIDEILVPVPMDQQPERVAAIAGETLLKQRGLTADTLTMQPQMRAAEDVVAVFVHVLKWVAALCITIGGVGVMNILLVGVRERRREIGVMKSLGATKPQICALFLLEALAYAMLGGALGILLGMVLVAVAGKSIGLLAVASWRDCAAVFLCALMIGGLSGLLPSLRAASMTCVDALRDA